MCTTITYQTQCHYFGRNLDLSYHYHEQIAVTPRRYPFAFRHQGSMDTHHALIGMATLCDGYPLYYEATNEKGLSIAGLHFPGNAHYFPPQAGKDNIAPFEFIPWVLGQCETLSQVRTLLASIQICHTPFSAQYPLSPLHWLIADREGSIVVECMQDGLHIHDNPVGVLTNNPPFDYHLLHLNHYMHLSPAVPDNTFAPALTLQPDSLGMGALGLPGDLSSPSRFVRAAFTRMNARSAMDEASSVSQFFHILQSVQQSRGCNLTPDQNSEITVYSSCCNSDTGVYYYTTYENSQISAVDMHRENLSGDQVIAYPMRCQPHIFHQN